MFPNQITKYIQARLLEREKKWKQAFLIYLKLVQNSPEDPALAYRLSFVAEKIKDYKTSVHWLLKAVQAKPEQHQWCRRLGSVALKAGQAYAAQVAYAHGRTFFTDATWHFGVGQLFEKAKDYEQAANFYSQALQLDPTQSQYHYRHGRALQQAGQYGAAIAAYKQALALGLLNSDTLICLARSLQADGQFEQAVPFFEQLVSLGEAAKPEHVAVARQQLGIALAQTGAHTQALEHFAIAIAMQPKSSAASRFAQAQSQEALGEHAQALRSLEQALALQPNNMEWQAAFAQTCMRHNGPFGRAAQVWQKLLHKQAGNTHYLLQHALALDMAGKPQEALKAYQKLHDLCAAEGAAPSEQNLASSQSEHAQDAIKAQAISWAQALSAYMQAMQCMQEKNYRDAQDLLTQALSAIDGSAVPHWHYRQAQALLLDGKYAEAEASLTKAIELLPHNTHYRYQLALVMRKQGYICQEVQALQQTLAIAQSPANTNPVQTWMVQWSKELEDAQEKMGRFGQAQEIFAQAQSQEAVGEHAQALRSLEQALGLQPDNTEWQAAFAQTCMRHNGPFGRAAQVWQKLLRNQSHNTNYLLQHALALDMAGKPDDALKAYQKLHDLYVAEGAAQSELNVAFGQSQQAQDVIEDGSHPWVQALSAYIQAMQCMQAKNYHDAHEYFTQALSAIDACAVPHWHYRQAQALLLGGKYAEAEASLAKAIELLPHNTHYRYQLALAIRKQGRTWQEVEALQQALTIAQSPANTNPNQKSIAQWQFELGDAQDKMNRFGEAGQAFAQANELQPGNAMWHFREGWAWERAQQPEKAQTAYAKAIAADQELKAKDFGIGVFHQHRGYWQHAATAYARTVQDSPGNAQLYYRLGMAHDRCYEWQQAAQHYRLALVLDPQQAEWHYRLGFVLERLELWEEAAKAYEYAATTRSTHTPDWFYRLGYVLEKTGDHEAACHAFLNTQTQHALDAEPAALPMESAMSQMQTHLSKDYEEQLKANILAAIEQVQQIALPGDQQVQALYKLGNQAERLQLWSYAAQAYRAAIARSNQHQSSWYYRLGYVLVQQGEWKHAASTFIDIRIFKQPHGIDMSRYEKNAGLMQVMEYAEYFETLPVDKHMVMYESYSGVSISCNPYAIYKAIADEPEFAGWMHVWVLNDLSRIPEECAGRQNVVFVARDSQLYMRYLATAGWLINNSTFPSNFIRRDEQKYLNTWHGTPLKTLGKDIHGNFMEHKNSARNLLHATHILSPNAHTTHVLLERNDVAGLYEGQLAETGYPRNDLVINAGENEKLKFRKKLGLAENGKPLVLYAPTWRGILGHPEIDSQKLIADLQILQQQDCQIVFRGHYFAERALAAAGLSNIHIAPQAIDTSELLAITDILITDYSSIFFDFLPTARPILFYTYDLEQYRQERGLYFDMEEMPGTKCGNVQQLGAELGILLKQVSHGDWRPDSKYSASKYKFSPNEDGKATQRAVDFFFNGTVKYKKYFSSKKNILIYIGNLDVNGITTSAINFIKKASKYYSVYLIFDAANENVGGRKHYVIEQIKDYASILSRSGRELFSVEAKWIDEKWMMNQDLNKEQWDLLKKSKSREFKRFFGNSDFSFIINFEGYSRFWASLLGFGGDNSKKIIWLHNNMMEEKLKKFPHQEAIFSLYETYEKLVSVSESVNYENKKIISKHSSIDENKFIYLNNFLDKESILSKANQPLDEDISSWLNGWNGFLFVNIGRFSVEKNQKRLIDSFSMFDSKENVRLAIMGQGPLLDDLNKYIKYKNLSNKVKIFEARNNPFPFLKRGNCFVLSSDHEGQGLVLLEAMTLGIPVISTDVPGPRSVLKSGEGLLVKPDTKSLFIGMNKFLNSKKEYLSFDAEKYNSKIEKEFLQIFK